MGFRKLMGISISNNEGPVLIIPREILLESEFTRMKTEDLPVIQNLALNVRRRR